MNRYTIFSFLLVLVLAAPLVLWAQETTTPPPAGSFVPLTSLPGLDEVASSDSLTDFLNNLYKICIGVAAALAVFQIIHGGVRFMTNKGSISENEQARKLIQGAVFGLILVLSPVIVFGIINPKILELDFDTSKLQSNFSGDAEVVTPGDDVEVTREYIPGAFLKYRGFDTNEAANDFINTQCVPNQRNGNASSIPEAYSDLIKKYEVNTPELRCPAPLADGTCPAGQALQWMAECEAESQQFWRFKPMNAGDSAYRIVPGDDERYAASRQFCSADNGFYDPTTGRDVFALPCGPGNRAKIDAAGFVSDEGWRCQQFEMRCEFRRADGSQ